MTTHRSAAGLKVLSGDFVLFFMGFVIADMLTFGRQRPRGEEQKFHGA